MHRWAVPPATLPKLLAPQLGANDDIAATARQVIRSMWRPALTTPRRPAPNRFWAAPGSSGTRHEPVIARRWPPGTGARQPSTRSPTRPAVGLARFPHLPARSPGSGGTLSTGAAGAIGPRRVWFRFAAWLRLPEATRQPEHRSAGGEQRGTDGRHRADVAARAGQLARGGRRGRRRLGRRGRRLLSG
jgi:hypothetical protein